MTDEILPPEGDEETTPDEIKMPECLTPPGDDTSIDIKILNMDVRDARIMAKTLRVREVRFLVDLYYQIQDFRMEAGSQVKAMEKAGEPIKLLSNIARNQTLVETEIKRWLAIYTDFEPTGMGRWAKSICGIREVISAGLLAHIDIRKAPTAGHIYRFGGIDPTLEWLGKKRSEALVLEILGDSKKVDQYHIDAIAARVVRKPETIQRICENKQGNVTPKSLVSGLARRPYNARLKVLLAFKLGECFVKVQNREGGYYGRLFTQRRRSEWERNVQGSFPEECAVLSKKYGKSTDAYPWVVGDYDPKVVWDRLLDKVFEPKGKPPVSPSVALAGLPKAAPGKGVPMLSPGHIHARGRRWTVKIFISHWHAEAYRRILKMEPPKPFSIEHLGHTHFIPPPPDVYTGDADEFDPESI